MRRTSGVVAVVVALLVAPMVVWGAVTLAQSNQPGGPGAPGTQQPGAKPVSPVSATGAGKLAEGKIKSMTGNKVILDNGTQLTLPTTMMGERSLLKEGMTVKASYEEKDGEKVVTSMDVRPTEDRSTEGTSSEKPASK